MARTPGRHLEPRALSHYHAPSALLPEGWRRDVLLVADAGGTLLAVEAGSPPGEAERLAGPVLPGLPNLHSHAFQRALAGWTERGSPGGGESFWSWREALYRFLAVLGPDEVEAIATQLYVEMLEAGYTSVVEFHYLHHDPTGEPYDDPCEMALRVGAAAGAAGIGLTLLPVVYRSGDFGGAPAEPGQRRFLLDAEGALAVARRCTAAWADHPQRRTGLALHSLRAVPPEALEAGVAGLQAADPAAPLHIHVAEQLREVEACLAWSGTRPVTWLLDHAPVDRRWCLVHATHVTEQEALRLAASGAVAGLCPTTEANLGDGLFPLPPYLEARGRLGVGSDSHVSVSPVEELRWLEYGQRLTTGGRAVAARGGSTGRALLDLALEGGAAAAAQPVGGLRAGLRADFVVLDAGHPVLYGWEEDDLVDAWIFSGNVPLVRDVFVAGRRVVAEGRHLHRDAVAVRFRKVLDRLRPRL